MPNARIRVSTCCAALLMLAACGTDDRPARIPAAVGAPSPYLRPTDQLPQLIRDLQRDGQTLQRQAEELRTS